MSKTAASLRLGLVIATGAVTSLVRIIQTHPLPEANQPVRTIYRKLQNSVGKTTYCLCREDERNPSSAVCSSFLSHLGSLHATVAKTVNLLEDRVTSRVSSAGSVQTHTHSDQVRLHWQRDTKHGCSTRQTTGSRHAPAAGRSRPPGFPRLSPCQRPRVSGILLVEAVASRRQRRAR